MTTIQQGLYLAPPHGELIANGTKSFIAKARPMGLEGEWILLSSGRAYGQMAVGEPEEVTLEDFRARTREHGVSEKERKRWWPERSPLYLYPVEVFQPFTNGPVTVELPPGVQTRVDIKGMWLPDIEMEEELLPSPPLAVQSLRLRVKAAGVGQPRMLQDGRQVVIARISEARPSSKKSLTALILATEDTPDGPVAIYGLPIIATEDDKEINP